MYFLFDIPAIIIINFFKVLRKTNPLDFFSVYHKMQSCLSFFSIFFFLLTGKFPPLKIYILIENILFWFLHACHV